MLDEPRVGASFRSFFQSSWVLPAAVFLVQLVGFLFLAFHRLIDSDEGFYLYISKLVFTKGTVLYRDVFYQQMPLLPYAYGAWMKLFGFGWEAGRSLSAVLAALMGTFIFHHVRRATGSLLLATSSLILYAFNLSALLFFLTAKTYVLSTATMLGSILVGAEREGRWNRWRAMLCGLLLAFSMQTRLFFAVVAPVVAVWFWRRGNTRFAVTPFWHFVGGFVIGMAPSLAFFAIAPRQFVYDNLLYHGMRDPAGLVGDFEQKLRIAEQLVVSQGGRHPTQLALLLCGVPLAAAVWKRISGTARLATLTAVALGLVSFLPTPAFGQYFCVLVPFLCIALAGAVAVAAEAMPGTRSRMAVLIGFALLSIASGAATVPRIGPLFIEGKNVPGVVPLTVPADWKISTVEQIASLIEANTGADSLVVSSWPGYLLTIDRTIYPKMENQIGIGTSWKLAPEDAHAFRMIRYADLSDAMADPRVQVVVAGNCTHALRPLYHEETSANGYRPIARVVSSEIFARESGSGNTGP